MFNEQQKDDVRRMAGKFEALPAAVKAMILTAGFARELIPEVKAQKKQPETAKA